MNRLEGKVALITGASSGIGLATARLFFHEGAQLVVTGRDRRRLAVVQEEFGDEVLAMRSDAGDFSEIEVLLQNVKSRFGHLDVLFLNAGTAKAGSIDNVSESDFDEMIEVNFKGVFFTIQQALPLLGKGSSIIVTTSITNQLGSPNFSIYGATKAALRSLVRSLSLDLIQRGIRINAISPGPIATPIFDRFGLPASEASVRKRQIEEKSPTKRFGAPEEIAKAVLFLASEDSSYMVGEEIVIDGGMSLL